MQIRKADISDVNEIVKIHCSAFRGFFLTSLGESFLKFYYGCFVKSNETVSCVAVDYVGRKSDVRPWLAASDVAILASYREGFPNVVIEAGAMGLPQIVTDINGANEIIVEGKNGTIVPSKNTDALYDAMKRMLDADYRSSLAKNARNMIASRYEQGFVRQCLLDFYDEIMK